MPWGSSAMNYAKTAWAGATPGMRTTALAMGVGTVAGGVYGGMSGTGVMSGAIAGGKMGALGPTAFRGGAYANAARGAIAGGVAGAVLADSPIMGMIGGAAAGRYGMSAFKAGRHWHGRNGAMGGAYGAGRGAWATLRGDAMRAHQFIGRGINAGKALGKIHGFG